MPTEWIILDYRHLLDRRNEKDLVREIPSLYHSIVHSIDPLIYSLVEQNAWSPAPPEIDLWIEKFRKAPPLLAIAPRSPHDESDSKNAQLHPLEKTNSKTEPGFQIIGFMNLEMPAQNSPDRTGHIDLAYVASSFQRMGVAGALYKAVEDQAYEHGLIRLTVDASHIARPFFLRLGYRQLTENQIPRNGLYITNFTLEKILDSKG